MDPFSVTAGCVGLVATIAALSKQISKFIREVRGARSDLDSVSRELHSLTTILEILTQDALANPEPFDGPLGKQISGIVSNCKDVITQIEISLQKHSKPSLGTGIKWSVAGQDDMTKFRSSLEAHKSALDIALDMATL